MSIEASEWIWHQGEWCRWNDARVHITTHALHYGSSVYDGIRCYATEQGPAIFRLDDHLRRLRNSCKLLRMDLADDIVDGLDDVCRELVIRNRHEGCYIRPLAYRGSGAMGLDPSSSPVEISLFSFEWGRYLGPDAIDRGVDVGVSSWRRFAPDALMPLGKIGGQYVNNQLATVEAKAAGFSEAVLLDAGGFVAEGAGQNLFVLLDGELVTPSESSSILAGITRDTILSLARDLGLPVRARRLTREMLYLADEMFMTGTASEITPVRSVDRIEIGIGRPGPLTRRLQKEFFGIVNGTAADRHGWMTPIHAEERPIAERWAS